MGTAASCAAISSWAAEGKGQEAGEMAKPFSFSVSQKDKEETTFGPCCFLTLRFLYLNNIYSLCLSLPPPQVHLDSQSRCGGNGKCGSPAHRAPCPAGPRECKPHPFCTRVFSDTPICADSGKQFGVTNPSRKRSQTSAKSDSIMLVLYATYARSKVWQFYKIHQAFLPEIPVPSVVPGREGANHSHLVFYLHSTPFFIHTR